jgi:hypothetical protein
MEFEQGWRMVGKVAAALALGALASAQTAGSEMALFNKKGLEIPRVSVEDDIRIPDALRGRIQRPGQELELVFKMHPRRDADPGAILPALEDMESSLVLRNGTPGAVAVIELHPQAPELRRGGSGARIVGFFDEDGKFEGQLPAGTRPRGVFANGREVTLFGLVKKGVAGHALPASKRPQTEEVDVEELAEQTYLDWVRAYTKLEFWNDHKVQRGASVENDLVSGDGELYVEPASPKGGQLAGTKVPLPRPRKPAIGGGRTLPGTIDPVIVICPPEPPEAGLPELPADPQGGRRAGEKIELQRPKPRRDHVLVHKR